MKKVLFLFAIASMALTTSQLDAADSPFSDNSGSGSSSDSSSGLTSDLSGQVSHGEFVNILDAGSYQFLYEKNGAILSVRAYSDESVRFTVVKKKNKVAFKTASGGYLAYSAAGPYSLKVVVVDGFNFKPPYFKLSGSNLNDVTLTDLSGNKITTTFKISKVVDRSKYPGNE